ncbi:MAG: aldehyde dehydrogenase (NADP(+)) [Opitutaceae bacterium]|nr:aldehyde dehydrogenase (NADP(+)) [Opitutaceae bacterium]
MTFHARNAATGETLPGEYHDAPIAEIDRVCSAAGEVAPEFAVLAPERRAALLEAIADGLGAASENILARAHLETGLPLPRLQGECGRTQLQLRQMAALVRDGSWVDARIDTAQPDRKPAPRPDLRRLLRGLGPVAVFGASNFPLAYSVAGGDTASALAAGCPVVVKAHPAHPGTSDLTAEVIHAAVARCGLPAGVFGMVHGAAPEVSLGVVRHPAIAAVGFTGSLRAGRALFDAAAARPVPIPVFAEMGSVNPVFVLPEALRERGAAIADGLVASFTLGMGQFCTKPGLVFGLASPEWDAFGAAVAAKAQAVAAAPMLHAGIAENFARGCRELAGVEWLATGTARVARVEGAAFLARPELTHEIFGPYTLLVTVRDTAQMLTLAGALEGQLTATMHGTDVDFAGAAALFDILPRRAGRVICNGFPTGVEVVAAMTHGGPYPACTDARFTAVGSAGILRWARPVSYQGYPDAHLPEELRDANPRGLLRLIDGKLTREPVMSARSV